jgi:pimeloyl-ACP methyl ester carboxylesterase
MRRIFLTLLLLLVVALLVNAVVTSRETEPAEADVGRILELPDGDLQVRERGPADAPAIVLLHCYTCSIHWWERLEPLLTPGHRVVSIDLLGHGGSEKPRDGYGTEEQGDLVATALERVGVRDALIVGQSLGGSIATALVERHPEVARGVVVMDSPPSGEYRDLPLTARIATAPVIGQAADRLATDGLIRDGLSDAFAEGFEVPDQFVEDVRRMTFTSFKDVPEKSGDYADAKSLDDRLAATGLPLLVIFGAEDTVVAPPEEAADEFRDVEGARIVMMPGVGHTPQVEAPAKTAALIRSFDRRLAR